MRSGKFVRQRTQNGWSVALESSSPITLNKSEIYLIKSVWKEKQKKREIYLEKSSSCFNVDPEIGRQQTKNNGEPSAINLFSSLSSPELSEAHRLRDAKGRRRTLIESARKQKSHVEPPKHWQREREDLVSSLHLSLYHLNSASPVESGNCSATRTADARHL